MQDVIIDNLSGHAYDPSSCTWYAVRNNPTQLFVWKEEEQGSSIQSINLVDFDDTESVAWVHEDSKIAIAEEDLKVVNICDPPTEGTTSIIKGDCDSYTVTPHHEYTHNKGIEGLTYIGNNEFVAVQEKLPMRVIKLVVDGTQMQGTELFDTTHLSPALTDLAGVHYDANTDSLLLLSEETRTVVQTNMNGVIWDTWEVQEGTQLEGISATPGLSVVHLLGEDTELFVYQPDPSFSCSDGSRLARQPNEYRKPPHEEDFQMFEMSIFLIFFGLTLMFCECYKMYNDKKNGYEGTDSARPSRESDRGFNDANESASLDMGSIA